MIKLQTQAVIGHCPFPWGQLQITQSADSDDAKDGTYLSGVARSSPNRTRHTSSGTARPGVPPAFVSKVLVTRVATDLRHGEFWRSVWLFFVSNASELDPVQVGPMIDYIQSVRHDQLQDGMTEFGSPQPEFSMKGRTVQSMLRLMRKWHQSLGLGSASLSWPRLPLNPLLFKEPCRDASEEPRCWQLFELTNSAQLRREGAALHHCVASYSSRCYRGASSIWSLRFRQAEKISHVLTVEVDPKKRAVVQARGKANRAASGKPLQLLQDWALQEGCKLNFD